MLQAALTIQGKPPTARPALPDLYLTEREFSDRYNVSPRTAQRWRAMGEGGPPFVRIGFRRIGYRLSDCESWAAGRTFGSRAAELAGRVVTKAA